MKSFFFEVSIRQSFTFNKNEPTRKDVNVVFILTQVTVSFPCGWGPDLMVFHDWLVFKEFDIKKIRGAAA